jgi:predicted transcriptional regulator
VLSDVLMKYRSRTDIIAMILESAHKEEGSTKTKIMYKAFLSFAQLKEYLMVLTQNGLLEYEEITQVYRTTQKGARYLHLYNNIDELSSTNLS